MSKKEKVNIWVAYDSFTSYLQGRVEEMPKNEEYSYIKKYKTKGIKIPDPRIYHYIIMDDEEYNDYLKYRKEKKMDKFTIL